MNLKTRIATIAAASIFALSMGTSALAATTDNVVQEVTAGTLSYSITGATLSPVSYSASEINNGGALTLAVQGNGNLSGWDLSVQATSAFDYVGTSPDGIDIPAANLSLISADVPAYVDGQVIDATHGPVKSASASAQLGEAVPVISAAVDYGSGSYTQNLSVSLNVPAFSQVGTYTGVVTVSTTAAPQG